MLFKEHKTDLDILLAHLTKNIFVQFSDTLG